MTSQQETKEKILTTANILFSKYGFEGTSIRDIASQSQVNIASVNYHFKTKQALYWAIFQRAYEWIDQGIADIADHSQNVSELIDQTFEFMLRDKAYIRNSMKMLLTENIGDPTDEVGKTMVQAGPPGGESIAKIISLEVGTSLSEEQLHWAVKTILGSLVHWTVMCSTSKIALMQACDAKFSNDNIKAGVKRIGQAVIEHLKSNQF